MIHNVKVSELPYEKDMIINTGYWRNVPDDWGATVWTCTDLYGRGIIGDSVTYVSNIPEDSSKVPSLGGLGEMVVRDIREVDEEDAKESKFADEDYAFDYTPRDYPDVGEIIGRFVHVPDVSFQHYYNTAPENPNWTYANNQAKGYAWGYIKNL